jgi:hypothetical protein
VCYKREIKALAEKCFFKYTIESIVLILQRRNKGIGRKKCFFYLKTIFNRFQAVPDAAARRRVVADPRPGDDPARRHSGATGRLQSGHDAIKHFGQFNVLEQRCFRRPVL